MSNTVCHSYLEPSFRNFVKALLYLAVISVFMRASIAAGPSPVTTTTTPNYLQYDNALTTTTTTTEPFQLIGDANNSAGVFGVVLASAAALLNGLA
ncbi:10631_t:CDS:2 [Ambispora leptoticha]|uniref:10631_t:CDS:1 n=1 Tax=Ambispora leptoticha TaxID=144679 RepID=A0A9N8VYS2_9GLOM|nr:10631_t:CDS:2 [Ambispora leptoticha]